MKKTIFFLITALLSQQAFSQTETFDIVSFTPPKDWKKEVKSGVVNYLNVNETTGTFCVITMYASSASTGMQKRF